MQLIHFLVSATLLTPPNCIGQAVNLACPVSNGTTGPGNSAVVLSVEIMYRSGTSDSEKRKIRSSLCATSVKNLGSPDEELLVVQVTGGAAFSEALNSLQKNHAVITARLASKSSIR